MVDGFLEEEGEAFFVGASYQNFEEGEVCLLVEVCLEFEPCYFPGCYLEWKEEGVMTKVVDFLG